MPPHSTSVARVRGLKPFWIAILGFARSARCTPGFMLTPAPQALKCTWGLRPRLYADVRSAHFCRPRKHTLEPAERVTAFTLDISFVVFDSIRLQEFNKFIAKRDLSVVLLLFRNVPANFVYV